MNKNFILAVSLLVFLLITGCQGARNATAEQAAVEQTLKNPGPGVMLDPGSIKVISKQDFENSTYIVLTYQRMWNNRDEQCLVMMETKFNLLTGWTGGSGGGSCTERANGEVIANDPLLVSGGTHNRSDQKKPDLSHVMGRVNDPSIIKVRVTWKDGQSQEAQVVGGSFLALRAGKIEMKSAEGLNAANKVIYTVVH